MLVQSEHVNLIETLAERMAAHCLADARVESVRVRVEKPDILPSCRSVGIEIERRRSSSGRCCSGFLPAPYRRPKSEAQTYTLVM